MGTPTSGALPISKPVGKGPPGYGDLSMQVWMEQILPDGRHYWCNSITGETCWETPAEMAAMTTTATTAVASQTAGVVSGKTRAQSNANMAESWREMTAANGRKYYYNTVTKMSHWEMPPEYAEYLERIKDPTTIDKEQAIELFTRLLKERGITSRFSWEEALREIIDHPHYKLVPTLAERKQLFAKYVEVQRDVEREQRHQEAINRREEFKRMLQTHPDVRSEMRWSEIMELVKNEPAYKAIESHKERVQLYEDFVVQMRKEEAERNRRRRRRASEKFRTLLLSMADKIKAETRWKTALAIFSAHDLFRNDPDLQTMDPMDLLMAYEDHIKSLEREQQHNKQEEREEKRRQERLNRKSFKELLCELEAAGQLTAASSWTSIFALIKDHPQLLSMLSQSGSTPLDLFWDHLHNLQEQYIPHAKRLVQLLKEEYGDSWLVEGEGEGATRGRKGLTMGELGRIAERDDSFSEAIIKAAYQHQASRRAEERRRIQEKVDQFRKEKRKHVDRYKHFIKHFSNPRIEISSKWDDFESKFEGSREYAEIDDVDVRRYYFDKYLRHLRKKAGISEGDSAAEEEEEEAERGQIEKEKEKDREEKKEEAKSKERPPAQPETIQKINIDNKVSTSAAEADYEEGEVEDLPSISKSAIPLSYPYSREYRDRRVSSSRRR